MTACVWQQTDYLGMSWYSTCNLGWDLPDGSPVENGMIYCPKCGNSLEESFCEEPVDEQEEEIDEKEVQEELVE